MLPKVKEGVLRSGMVGVGVERGRG